ncbi:NADH dehydrogenase [Methylovorus sp. MM2]|uniref:NADH dehydrogenase n=1 Tax=Methylovorus sp. MM2 TaxID=1848038 RepID=UPI0007DF93C9|nr:NADH dehydrogenase [Methylovorus sp. MM2]OAM53139.1 NADH dehydrogenase [Methylovorus sp. MM2]
MQKIKQLFLFLIRLEARIASMQSALGRIEARQNILLDHMEIANAEFKVFSQWGEDGVIQYLISKVAIKSPVFVEFGVENYTESNTRFLLTNNNWSGLVIDGSEKNINYIKADHIYWRHNLKADCAFITKDNINQIIERNGIQGEIGLLSVDIDGNDYWVWSAINVVNPCIVVCEYNSLWGATKAVTTPYDPSFTRGAKHYSNLYYGASIQALTILANEKGYSLVGSNKAGNNVFFVRNDLLGDIKTLKANETWVKSEFRESRDKHGNLTFLDFDQRLDLLAELPLFDIDLQQTTSVKQLFN